MSTDDKKTFIDISDDGENWRTVAGTVEGELVKSDQFVGGTIIRERVEKIVSEPRKIVEFRFHRMSKCPECGAQFRQQGQYLTLFKEKTASITPSEGSLIEWHPRFCEACHSPISGKLRRSLIGREIEKVEVEDGDHTQDMILTFKDKWWLRISGRANESDGGYLGVFLNPPDTEE